MQLKRICNVWNMCMLRLLCVVFLMLNIGNNRGGVTNQAEAVDISCADRLQQCGVLVEDLERRIEELKATAFKDCFTSTACVQERIAFDDCFSKTIHAVRSSSTRKQPENGYKFSLVSNTYNRQVEECFNQSPTTPSVLVNPSSTFIDDSIHAKAVYLTEWADRLWGLSGAEEKAATEASLNIESVCLFKEAAAFGKGVANFATNQTLERTCSISSEELACYRHTLEADLQFRQLLFSRYTTLRLCIQNARLESECRRVDVGLLRSCVCNAREYMETQMLKEILSCVQNSSVAKLYSTLVDMSSGKLGSGENLTGSPLRRKQQTTTANITTPPEPALLAFQQSDDPITISSLSSSSSSTLARGVMLSDGQCVCACPLSAQQRTGTVAVKTTDPLVAASTDYLNPRLVHSSPYAGKQSALPWYYSSYYQRPRPLSSLFNTEAGIASGFESFFNGEPPPL